MNANLNLIKPFLKVDGTDADDIISGYQGAAEQYITNAGCTVDYTNQLCVITIAILVEKLYDNPDLLSISSGENIGITLNNFIAQLRAQQAPVPGGTP